VVLTQVGCERQRGLEVMVILSKQHREVGYDSGRVRMRCGAGRQAYPLLCTSM